MEISKWKSFKEALRKPEEDIFENMLLRSKLYASAAGMATRPIVFDAMVMSILLDHHIQLLQLATEIERLKNPKSSKEPEGIEKFLQPLPPMAPELCQTTINTTPEQGND